MKNPMPNAKDDEVYAAYEYIDFGDGIKRQVIVIYPKNKLITRMQSDNAITQLRNKSKGGIDGN